MYKEIKEYDEYIAICISKHLYMQYNFRQETENSDKYYELFAYDENIRYECHLDETDEATEIADFETKYKAQSNKYLERQRLEDSLPKMTHDFADTVSGVATVITKIPGTPGVDKRRLKGAYGWFDNPTAGDTVKAWMTDENNMLQMGSGTVLASFNDDEAPEDKQGWFLTTDAQGLSVKGFEDLMDLTSGFDMKIQATKADIEVVDVFRVNYYWGKRNGS